MSMKLLYSYKDKFRGIGIIFDTFKNTEAAHIHRDVTVIVNDGEQNWESMVLSGLNFYALICFKPSQYLYAFYLNLFV